MEAHTSERATRRVTQTAAHKRVICVRPRLVMAQADWSLWFERRALMHGHTAVIDGIVCEPGSPEARAAITKATQ